MTTSSSGFRATDAAAPGQYATVNGLEMYYEVHGTGRPLVLLHGALSAIGTSFGKLWPVLAQTRQVIGVEMQAHGRTADIDRPLAVEHLAEDVAALLRQIGIVQADFFGYSLGAAVALQVAVVHPELVRKLVLAAISFKMDGVHPGLHEGIAMIQPEQMVGSQWYKEYVQLAPHPEDFPRLLEKVKQMDANVREWPAEAIQALTTPALLIIGDSDIVRPEHIVEMFRLLGGGVSGDTPAGLPVSQLAVLPGTSHTMIPDRAELLLAMIPPFLDSPGGTGGRSE